MGRRRTLDAQKQSEQNYRHMVELSPDGILVISNGRIAFANEAAVKLRGAEVVGSLLGQPVDHLFHMDICEAVAEYMVTFLKESPQVSRLEGMFQRADGTSLDVEVAGMLVFYDGRPALQMTIRDVTERKRAEAALRSSEQRFSAVFNSSPVAKTIATLKEGRYVDVNRAFEQLTGYDRDEVLGATAAEMGIWLDPDEREKILSWLPSLGVISNIETRFRTKSGEIRDIFASASPVFLDGVEYVLFVFSNTTEQNEIKQLKEELRQSQKMEAVGRLAGGVAHDFNNLLTAIIGYSQLLLTQLEDGNRYRRKVVEILKAGQRAAGLTRQLLTFSRRQVVQTRVFDLNASIADMENLLRKMIGEDLDLSTELDWSHTANVKGDSGQMEQVIMNLVVNARDAMPLGGKIELKTDIENVDGIVSFGGTWITPGRYVTLSVTDSGCGIPPGVRSHIFEPFFTTKEKGKGTGLGLSTVYGIVEESGGHIGVTSDMEIGSTFKIYLPEASEPADAPDHARADLIDPRPTGCQVVLLVEDDAAICELASEVLRTNGYKVIEASSGKDALAKSRDHEGQIDLILTDVVMPGLSGRLLAERMTTIRPGIKVLYMSGSTDDALLRHRILEGMPFLPKPFTPDELASKVGQMFSPTAH